MGSRLVVLDAAGTLLELRRPVGETYAELTRRAGVELDPTVLEDAFHRVFRAAPPLAFGKLDSGIRRVAERDWWRLVTVGPDGFEQQARLRFIPDPQWDGQSENDVTVEGDLPPEHEVMAMAAGTLARHTGTPEDCYFAWWDGWPAELDGPTFALPNRAHHLMHGTVADRRLALPLKSNTAIIKAQDADAADILAARAIRRRYR